MRNWMAVGAILAGLGVAAGAFGAHAVADRIGPELLAVYETAARYHLVHAVALVVVGLAARGGRGSRAAWNLAGWSFSLGILVFAGSLYLLALSGERWLGAVTPLGGVGFLIGWGAVAWAAIRDAKAGELRDAEG